ncbi:MAG: TolC family protein [Elusimicrobia bacterium]|nr:TolC family protein [Elusimicrobiota bacterium]
MKTLLALFAFVAAPAAAETLPLSSLVDRVLARDPAAASARAGVDEVRRARSEVLAQSLPRLSAKLSYMRGDDPLFVFGSILQERAVEASHFGLGFLRGPGYRTQVRGALEAGVPLFTGFQLSSARRRAALGAEAAESGSRAVEEERRRAAVDAALDVLASQARLSVLEVRLSSASAMVEDARRLTKSGVVLGSEFYAAEALLAKLRGQAAMERRALEGVRARLSILSGVPDAAPSGSLAAPPPGLAGAEALSADASARRGDLRAAELGAQSSLEGAAAARRSLLPSVEAFGQVQESGRGFLDGGTSRLVGLRAELPFGDPGYPSRRGRLEAAARRSREAVRAGREAAAADIASARAAYAGALDAFPELLSARDHAAHSLELFRPLYRQGRQSVMEVLRAEDALTQAELAVIAARRGLYAGWAGLRQAAGTFGPEAVKDLERALEDR